VDPAGPDTPATVDLKSGSSFQARLTLWQASLDATAERPVTGHGLGTVADAIAPHLTGPDARLRGVTPHSGYLRVAVELGVPGLLIQIAITLVAIWLAVVAVFGHGTPVRALVAGILAAILVHQVFGTILFGGFSFGNFMFALAVGLLATLAGRAEEPRSPDAPSKWRGAP
jgi:O-antigen ligase